MNVAHMDAYPVFTTVVEEEGFAPAARKLGVSKSAVSKRVAALEAHLGVQLLHRSTRQLSLTEAGERFFPHAIRAIEAAQQAENAVSDLQSRPVGVLKVNAPMSFGRRHLAPLTVPFLQAHPELELDLVLDDRRVDLIEGGFDMAIRAGTLTDSSLIARKLAPCRNVLAASPDYLQRRGVPIHPDALLDHECLHYSYFSGRRDWQFSSPDGDIVVSPPGRLRINNSDALLEAAVAGLGIARLTSFIAADALASGALVRVLPDWQMAEQTIYAVFPERRHLPDKVRLFVEFLVVRFGGDRPYWDQPERYSKVSGF